MSDDLRARILEALNTAPAAGITIDPDEPWRRHDEHRYNAFCALCRGEAETLADAVMAVVNEHGPDDLDQFVREQASSSPEFAAAVVEAEHSAKARAFEDLLSSIYLYVSWQQVTKQLTTEQKTLWADAVDANWQRMNEADPGIRLGTVPRWWMQ